MTHAGRRGLLSMLRDVLRQPMFVLLLGGGVVYLLIGDRVAALILLVFASLSMTITLVQKSRSEKVLEALSNLASPRAMVIRGGQRCHIAGREVVRGDLIVVSEGDRVAADATLLDPQDLLLDESLPTGEYVTVRKLAEAPGVAEHTAATRSGELHAAAATHRLGDRTGFAGACAADGRGHPCLAAARVAQVALVFQLGRRIAPSVKSGHRQGLEPAQNQRTAAQRRRSNRWPSAHTDPSRSASSLSTRSRPVFWHSGQ